MASITVQLDHVCAGNSHAHVDVNFDGIQIADVLIHRADIMTPLSTDEATAILTALVRIHCRGMTANQVRNALLNGFRIQTLAGLA